MPYFLSLRLSRTLFLVGAMINKETKKWIDTHTHIRVYYIHTHTHLHISLHKFCRDVS